MAIFSVSHKSIGKTTQAKPFTAAAHVRYITRKDALGRLDGERLPVERAGAMRWFKAQEKQDRKNARVADKVMLALPRELNEAERAALVRAFAEHVTKGRASWLAAFHDRGKDRSNPHCHLLLRDRDVTTGKRVIGMSEAGSTEKLRLAWELHCNRALERAGRSERVDRRTLARQGLARTPTVHEGPRAREMHARGAAPRSRAVRYRNGAGARARERLVDYRRFDNGVSRPAYNQALRAPAGGLERDHWFDIDRDRVAAELRDLERIHRPDRFENADNELAFWRARTGRDDLDRERALE